MRINPVIIIELATIAALCTTAVGAAQIRHVEGRIALLAGIGLLVVAVVGRVLVGA